MTSNHTHESVTSSESSPKTAEQSLEAAIKYHESRPGTFLRKAKFFHHGEEFPETTDEALNVRDKQLDLLMASGVNIPQHETVGVRVEEDGKPYAYDAAERVLGDGLDLALVNKDPRLTTEMLTNHYQAILEYMKGVFHLGGYYLSDINSLNNRQAMFGHTVSDMEDKIYLIDTEPYMEKFHKNEPLHKDNGEFFRSLENLEGCVAMARMFGHDMSPVLASIEHFKAEARHTREK